MSQQQNTGNFNADSLLLLIWKWRIPFIVVIFLTIVVSAIISLVMEERYKSTVILFPAKTANVALGEKLVPVTGSTLFGEEEEAEQMLQILNSSEIRDRIVKKHNLMDHYEISPDSKYKYTELTETYNENVSCTRTRYGSINIEVLDKSPEMAAKIANDIAKFYDSTKNRMIHENALLNFKIIEREYNVMLRQIDEIVDTLGKLRMLGVVGDEESQAALLQAYSSALGQRNATLTEQLAKQVENNRKYGSSYSAFAEQLEQIMLRREILKGNYDQAKSDATANVSHKFVVDTAMKSEKKAYPIRWLIVAISTIAAFFFMVVFVISVEKLKELRLKAAARN